MHLQSSLHKANPRESVWLEEWKMLAAYGSISESILASRQAQGCMPRLQHVYASNASSDSIAKTSKNESRREP